MKHVRSSSLALVLALVTCAVAGCKDGGAPSGTSTTTGAKTEEPTPAAAKPAPKDARKTVSLAPLPLQLVLPAGEAGLTMDKSMGDHKSVGVSYDAISAGVNVSEPADKTFAEVKKGLKGDTVVFPFKRFVKDEPTRVVSEFAVDGTTGYLAYAWKEVSGKPYLCQSAGLSGLKTPEDAEKIFAVCDTLAPAGGAK